MIVLADRLHWQPSELMALTPATLEYWWDAARWLAKQKR